MHAKKRDEEQRLQKEGTTYGASAFNELAVTAEPAKKRKHNRNIVSFLLELLKTKLSCCISNLLS